MRAEIRLCIFKRCSKSSLSGPYLLKKRSLMRKPAVLKFAWFRYAGSSWYSWWPRLPSGKNGVRYYFALKLI